MNTPLPPRPGTRVKLNARGARNQVTSSKRPKIDWSHRCGILQSANKRAAYVLWDGRHSLDPVPLPYLETLDAWEEPLCPG